MCWQYLLLAIIPGLTYPLIYFSYLSQIKFKRMEINRIFTEEALKNYIKAYGPCSLISQKPNWNMKNQTFISFRE